MTSITDRIRQARAAQSASGEAEPPPPPARAPLPPNLPPAGPCPAPCLCPSFWLDSYGIANCFACSPPKIAAQVRMQLFAKNKISAPGEFEWEEQIDGEISSGNRITINTAEKNNSGGTQKNPSMADIFLLRQITPPNEYESFDVFWDSEMSARSANIEAVQMGMLRTKALLVPGKNRPTPPASAKIWQLLKNGQTAGPGTDTKPSDKNPAVLFTWEGAGQWWPVESKSEAVA